MQHKEVFDGYNLGWLYDYLVENGFKIKEDNYHEDYFVATNDGCICFLNLGESLHPNVDMRLGIDNAEAFNKIGQLLVSIDVFNTSVEEVSKWVDFLGSVSGFEYSYSFGYLDDETRPCCEYKWGD